MLTHLKLLAGLVLLLPALLLAADSSAGQSDYLAGLESLQQKHWQDAGASFARAAQANDENADYHTAAGIAAMMAGDMAAAQREFDRAVRLNPRDNTTQLWAAGFYRMKGDALTASRIHPPSDYSRTVQEAAEKVGQLRYDTVSPQEALARHERLEGFAVQYARDRESASPDMAKTLWAKVQKEYDTGQFDAAGQHLAQVAKAFPDDPAPRRMQGKIELARNQLLSARRTLTAALTMKTDDADGYAARAVTHARLGELQSAAADIDLARRYDSKVAALWQTQYDAAVKSHHSDPAKASPEQLWAALQKSVETGRPFEQQVAAATELLHAGYAHRLWWDEWYQSHLRQLEDDLRAHPRDLARLDTLGRFLLDESDDPGEQLCPKGPYRAFRDAHPTEEIARADSLFRQALTINPNDVAALAGAAEILLMHGQYGDGETLVRKALQVDKSDPQVLLLLSKVLDYAADLRAGSAAELRTPRTWISGSGPGYTIWTTRYPSLAEQDRANQLDQIAQQLWEQSKQQLSAAVRSHQGTAEGAYFAALIAVREGNRDQATSLYQQAVKLDSTSKRYRSALANSYAKAGKIELAVAEKETMFLQRHTTANTRFVNAWNDLDRTAYTSAARDLDSAFPIDPADERNASYRGVLAHAQKQLPQSIMWYSIALAMDEARLRSDGLSANPTDKAALPAYAASMPMVLARRIGARQRELNQPDAALASFRRNTALEARIDRHEWAALWAEAVLPDPLDTKAADPPSVDSLSAWSHVLAGNTLLAMNKPEEAEKEFLAVARDPRSAGPMDTFLEEKPVIDPHWSAYADATRLHWARLDPDSARRPHWLTRAQSLRWLSGDEVRAIQEIHTNERQAQMDQELKDVQRQGMQNAQAQREAALRKMQEMQHQARPAGGQLPPNAR